MTLHDISTFSIDMDYFCANESVLVVLRSSQIGYCTPLSLPGHYSFLEPYVSSRPLVTFFLLSAIIFAYA